jgi:hypothetical protein
MAKRKERFSDLSKWFQEAEKTQLLTEEGPSVGWVNAIDSRGNIVGQWLPDAECRAFGVKVNGWMFV